MAEADGITRARAGQELLAWLILAFRPVTEASAQQLLSVDLSRLLHRAGFSHHDAHGLDLDETDASRLASALETEYVRLFVNNKDGEVAWLEALAYLVDEGHEAQMAYLGGLHEAYAAAGLRPSEETAEAPDHLTLLLELLYSVGTDDPTALRQHPLAERFLRGWLPSFLERLEAAQPPPFYEVAGRLLARVLGLDAFQLPTQAGLMSDQGQDETKAAGETGIPPEVFPFHARVLESVTDGILVVDRNKKIVYVNDVFAKVYGVEPKELLGQPCSEAVGFDHCKNCPHADLMENPEEHFTGHNLRCDRLSKGPYCVSASPYHDENGEVVGVVEMYRDMRSLGAYIEGIEQKNEELDNERRRLDNILTDSSDGYYTASLDRKVLTADSKLLELLGKTEAEVIGKGCNEIFGSDKCETDCPIRWAGENHKNVIDCRELIRTAEGVLPVDKSIFLNETADGDSRHVIGVVRNASEIVALRRTARAARRYKQIVTRNRKMEEVFSLIDAFGPTDATVLIQGESGTGKELVATAIQESSPRRKKPFLKINCSALSEGLLESELFGHVRGAFTGASSDKMGKFEAAHGGTLFLDEVGDMSPTLQTKILRVLEQQEFEPVGSTETRKVNVRIIAATNRDLRQRMRDGSFREDLYYRLNATQIHLPTLRDRSDDIPLLVGRFLSDLDAVHGRAVEGISARALDLLVRYPWPGNVRELRHAMEFAYICATGSRIERADLPEQIRNPEIMAEMEGSVAPMSSGDERQRLEEAMTRFGGNRALVAKALGISRTTLWRRLKALQIEG